MSLLTPLALLGVLLAIPILLLYMLRLRRREVLVSSTFLWQQILRDREANTPWQKLRRNLLLLLQLLILLLIVLALARPFMTVPAVSAGQTAVLIDTSLSMNAMDGQAAMSGDAQTRLNSAKAQALAIVDTMSDADTMTVIGVGEAPVVFAPPTNDRAALRAAINAVAPGYGQADWDAALTLAAGAQTASALTVVVISDGGGALNASNGTTLPAIPGTLRYIPVGTGGDNVAITALATRALGGEAPQLFAQVTNYGTTDAEVIFDLRVNDDLFSAERYTIPAGESQSILSRALPNDARTLKAGISAPADTPYPDFLSQDDAAYAIVGETGARRVLLVSEGNLFLEQALRTIPGVQAYASTPLAGIPAGDFDLYVFENWLPATLPEGDLLFINPPASNTLFTVGETLQRPETLDQDDPTANIRVLGDDPRTAFVEMSGVNLLAFRAVTASWATALIEAAGGPLVLAGETDGRQVGIFTFDIRDSDLPLNIAFPILMASLLDWYAPPSLVPAATVSLNAPALIFPPPNASLVRVTLPDGSTRDLTTTGDELSLTETSAPGLYTVEALAGDALLQTGAFAVNLFDAAESAITPYSSIQLGEQTITPQTETALGQREFWPWLAALGLLILLIEWAVYHRRVRAPVRFRPLAWVRARGAAT